MNESVKISINDIRKCVNYPGGVEAIDLIIDKLEEIEERLSKIENFQSKLEEKSNEIKEIPIQKGWN